MIAEPLGGAFGGKFALVEPLAVGAALALQRPVRLVLTRSEDFAATNPASAQVTHLKVGARADGTLTAIEARMIVDRGTNAGWGVEGGTSLLVAGPYRWQAHDLRGYGVQTNRFTFGAYRAPGAPTAAFALESLLDELAQTLDLDPIELRLKNAVVEGDVGVGEARFPPSAPSRSLERLREHPLWAQRDFAAGRRRRRHGRRPLARRHGARLGGLPGRRRRHDDRRHLGGRHERREQRLRRHRRGRVRALARPGARGHGRHRVGPYAGASGGRRSPTPWAWPSCARPRPRERLLAAASQELEIAPGDSRWSTASCGPWARPTARSRAEGVEALRFGGRYEPIEELGGSAQTSAPRRWRAPLARARRSRGRAR